jgi:hypothetical protein
MNNLQVDVSNSEISVTRPNTNFVVTYVRDKGARMLFAPEVMRINPDPLTAAFLADAWRATYAKARELGWI